VLAAFKRLQPRAGRPQSIPIDLAPFRALRSPPVAAAEKALSSKNARSLPAPRLYARAQKKVGTANFNACWSLQWSVGCACKKRVLEYTSAESMLARWTLASYLWKCVHVNWSFYFASHGVRHREFNESWKICSTILRTQNTDAQFPRGISSTAKIVLN
jgi:hypothetical protein